MAPGGTNPEQEMSWGQELDLLCPLGNLRLKSPGHFSFLSLKGFIWP